MFCFNFKVVSGATTYSKTPDQLITELNNKVSDKTMYDINYQLTDEQKISNTTIICFSFALGIYWIVLLFIYEKENKYESVNYTSEEELFEKYNPLVGACIAQNRDALSRDIIAVILDMINKGIIKLDIGRDTEEKDGYKYTLYRIKSKEHLMDDIQKHIHGIIFEFVCDEKIGVDLLKKLKDIPKMQETYVKFQELNQITKKELNELGANINKVPLPLRIYNVVLFIISIVLCIYHMGEVGIAVEIKVSTVLIILFIISIILMTIPLMIALSYLVLKIIGYTKKGINLLNERKLEGQKIFSTSVGIILAFIVLIILTAIFAGNKYLVLDEILLGISMLIVRTDNLMLKNDRKILKDYNSLKRLKDKIEGYTTLDEKDIEQITLWKDYLVYAVAFGYSTEVFERLHGLKLEDRMIEDLKNYDLLYYSCKAYLEIFFDMRFKNIKKKDGKNISKDDEDFDIRSNDDKLFESYEGIERMMKRDNWLD